MKRSIAIADRRTYAEGRLLWLVLLSGAVLVSLLWTTAASGATAYYSFEGFLAPGVAPTQYFAFAIDRGIARPAPFSLRTWHYGGTPTGQTNAAGDTIPGGSFDPILRLYHLGGSVIVTNDDGPFGLDSLINWSTPGMPEQLPAGAYGVDLYPFSGGGDWAVDVLAEAAKFSLTGADSFGTDLGAIYSLKIGSDDRRVPAKFELPSYDQLELYYHYEFDAKLVVGNSGSAEALIYGDLDTGHSVLGWQPDSIGTMILDYGSWHDHFTYGATYVGLYGEGNLEVRQGGDAQFDYNLVLGLSAGSEGNVIVTGPYAYIEVYSGIEVGAAGVGTLQIENQGRLNTYLLNNTAPDVVASLPLSTGTVDVDGYNSVWDTDALVVGDGGQGIVRVTNGGKIDTHGNGYVGRTSSAAASSMTVTGLSPEGDKASWLVHRDLHIAGTSDGASNAANSHVAINTGGRVDVAGTTTIWNGGGSLELLGGEMETGSLIVKPGATFTHTDGTLTVNGGTFDPGVGSGNYLITGADGADRPKLVMTNSTQGTLSGGLLVGVNNSGELTIENGATLRASNVLSSFAGITPATSKATVQGAGSQLIITAPSLSEPLEVGYSGPSELIVSNGGQVHVQQGGVSLGRGQNIGGAGSGEITVEGADSRLEAAYVNLRASGGNSRVRIHDHGVVHATDLTAINTIWPASSHSAEVEVTDAGSRLQIDGQVLYVLGDFGGGAARLTIQNGGMMQLAGDICVEGAGLGSAYVDVDGGAAASANLNAGGTVYVGGDRYTPYLGTAVVTVAHNARLTADKIKVWQPGNIQLSGGTIHTGILTLEGTLRGSGNVTGGGQLDNAGLVSPGLLTPGAAAGTIHLAGDYTQLAAGAMEMEIGGLAPSQFDRLQVDGTATLGGSLRIDLVDPMGGLNPFQPSAGDSFPLLTAGLLGPPNFSDVILPELGPDLRMVVIGDLQTSILSAQVFLSGDYNFDGIVDAADYTVWRDTLGSTTDLRANGDNTGASGGVVDTADFLAWKSHFGMTVGSGSLALRTTPLDASGGIPEPAALTLVSLAVVWLLFRQGSASATAVCKE